MPSVFEGGRLTETGNCKRFGDAVEERPQSPSRGGFPLPAPPCLLLSENPPKAAARSLRRLGRGQPPGSAAAPGPSEGPRGRPGVGAAGRDRPPDPHEAVERSAALPAGGGGRRAAGGSALRSLLSERPYLPRQPRARPPRTTRRPAAAAPTAPPCARLPATEPGEPRGVRRGRRPSPTAQRERPRGRVGGAEQRPRSCGARGSGGSGRMAPGVRWHGEAERVAVSGTNEGARGARPRRCLHPGAGAGEAEPGSGIPASPPADSVPAEPGRPEALPGGAAPAPSLRAREPPAVPRGDSLCQSRRVCVRKVPRVSVSFQLSFACS
ncbi:translation initiation factor IF-2-like [Gallus gallus]|uniref:translation initiation factor IF-2-like n=1 Tax=Gallus gallus TaxID=9031 RepID=UPI001F02AC84|nr:translation initiation factor IF-2-like [Gallus gallus]